MPLRLSADVPQKPEAWEWVAGGLAAPPPPHPQFLSGTHVPKNSQFRA